MSLTYNKGIIAGCYGEGSVPGLMGEYPCRMGNTENDVMSGVNSIVKCDETHLWTAYDRGLGRMRVVTAGEIRKDPENWLIPSQNGGWRRINRIVQRPAEPVQCVLVDDPHHVYELADGTITHNTGGGKSVLQRNVVFHVIAHAREIKFFGIDLKRVELSSYRDYAPVLFIATTLEDAVEVLNLAQGEMMERYGEMEEHGVQNFLDLENPGSALLVMVDEAGELLDTSAPAKALAGSTFIPTLEERECLRDVEPGDHVLGTDLEWHVVKDRYEPVAQDHYRVGVSRMNGESESFVAGAEHLWRVWAPRGLAAIIQSAIDESNGELFEEHDGEDFVTAVLTTKTLARLKSRIDPEDWVNVRLRRSKKPGTGLGTD